MHIRAITVYEPWASLLALGVKRHETRTHRLGLGRIAIHSATGFPARYREYCFQEPFCSILEAAGLFNPSTGEHRFKLGHVIAIANLTACLSTDDAAWVNSLSEQERAFGNYEPHRYGWLMNEVKILRNPQPTPGAQGIWTFTSQERLTYADSFGDLAPWTAGRLTYPEIRLTQEVIIHQQQGDVEGKVIGICLGFGNCADYGAIQVQGYVPEREYWVYPYQLSANVTRHEHKFRPIFGSNEMRCMVDGCNATQQTSRVGGGRCKIVVSR